MGAFDERLDLLEVSGQLDREVREVTEAIVAELAALHGTLDEDNAGMLVSHLGLSLQRLRQGVVVEPDALVVAEAEQYPDELALATRLARHADRLRAGSLPDGEVRFLAVHLRALKETQEGV